MPLIAMSCNQALSEKMRQTEAAICKLLQWDEMQYCNFKYEYGLKYIRCYDAPERIKCAMESCSLFWGWWKLHWYYREKVFAETNIQCNADTLMIIYKGLHNPITLINSDKLYPSVTISEKWYKSTSGVQKKEVVCSKC